LNYLLDCLPAAVLQFGEKEVKELHVRTCVARGVKLRDYTDLTLAQLRKRVGSSDPRAKQDLLEVYGLFASEYDYRPLDMKKLPYGDFAAEYARRTSKRLVHRHGAIRCLERLLGLVADDGFILVNDYGSTQTSHEDQFEHQRFSLATFVGVNFPEVEAYFGEGGSALRGSAQLSERPSPPAPLPEGEGRNSAGEGRKYQVVKPSGDARGIHSRLFSRKPSIETITRFFECFSDAAHEKLQTPIKLAPNLAKAQRRELAFAYYQEALRMQPGNWVLLDEVSRFLTFSMHDPKWAANLARIALSLNPNLSADLWSTLGDALFEWGRTVEAKGAYNLAVCRDLFIHHFGTRNFAHTSAEVEQATAVFV
jgi:tetratricopeptide (TPR) repeat protein